MVGRAVEVAALREALDAATRGRGSLLFLVGEAGVGKSRLIDVVASDAVRHGLPVLRGRAVSGPSPVAYRPLTEALSSAVRAGASPLQRHSVRWAQSSAG